VGPHYFNSLLLLNPNLPPKTLAMNLAKEKREHHIVFIITDGQVVDEQDSRKAVVAASRLPISIVVIGVGDGPWEVMEVCTSPFYLFCLFFLHRINIKHNIHLE